MEFNRKLEREEKIMKEYKGYNYAKVGETYTVYTKEGKPWIVGFKTEAEAKDQIDDLVLQEENANIEQITIESLQEQITELQLAMVEIAGSEV